MTLHSSAQSVSGAVGLYDRIDWPSMIGVAFVVMVRAIDVWHGMRLGYSLKSLRTLESLITDSNKGYGLLV
jgi:hypothetical protein